jgi:hypothetical protein
VAEVQRVADLVDTVHEIPDRSPVAALIGTRWSGEWLCAPLSTEELVHGPG